MKAKSPMLIAFVTVAIDLLGFGLIVPLLGRYTVSLGAALPDAWVGPAVGVLMAGFSAMQFLLAPVWGRLSDRIGRRPVILIGLTGSVVAYTLFGLATLWENLPLLFISRFGQGVAGATIATAQAIIADCTPGHQRSRGMALIGMAFGIGFVFGPLIGYAAVHVFPPASATEPSAAPGFVAAVICALGLAQAYFRLPETLGATSQATGRGWLDLAGLGRALGSPALATPLITSFLAITAFATFEGTLSRMTLDALNLSDDDNFLVFFYVGIILTLAQGLLVRRLLPRIGEPRMARAGILLMAVGLGGLAWAAWSPNVAVLLSALTLSVVGFAALNPSIQGLISRNTSADRQGEILGVAQAVGALARIAGPFLGNVLYGGARGGQQAPFLPFLVGSALMAVALVFALRLEPGPAEDPAPPALPEIPV
jgi:MFS family permease